MSEYISDTPQALYRCVACAIDACLGHVTEASHKLPTKGLGNSERACSVHDMPQTCAEHVR